MIYTIEPTQEKIVAQLYSKALAELNDFYEIDWQHHVPRIILVKDRRTVELLKGTEDSKWITGWTEGKSIFLLTKEALEQENSSTASSEVYYALIKHELSHCFYKILSNQHSQPIWLNEGIAIYVSGQNQFKKKPQEFSTFLEFYEKGGKGVYNESGFFVEMLVQKFGKNKLLDLIRNTKNTQTKEEFETLFKEEYGFDLTYEEINDFYTRTHVIE